MELCRSQGWFLGASEDQVAELCASCRTDLPKEL